MVVRVGGAECVGGDSMRCSVEEARAKLSSERGGEEPVCFAVKVEMRRLHGE